MHTEDIDVVCGHEGAPHIAKVILVCLFSRLDAEIKYIVLLICGSTRVATLGYLLKMLLRPFKRFLLISF